MKPGADPRLVRIRALYHELEGIPERKREFGKRMKEEAQRLHEQIEAAWSQILEPAQTKMTFTVHHGDTLVGYGRQPKRAGGG
jgi:hypothetical protein